MGSAKTAKVALGEHEWIKPGEIWVFSPSFDEQKGITQRKLERYLPKDKILDSVWLRKGIVKEWTIDAGNGRKSKITFKSYAQAFRRGQIVSGLSATPQRRC